MRYLVSHPQVQLGTSLLGRVTGQFEKANYGVLGKEHDVVFLCLPHGQSQGPVEELISTGCKVVDLGADFRFADAEAYRKTYGEAHHARNSWERPSTECRR